VWLTVSQKDFGREILSFYDGTNFETVRYPCRTLYIRHNLKRKSIKRDYEYLTMLGEPLVIIAWLVLRLLNNKASSYGG
jgi:hypothetical protein